MGDSHLEQLKIRTPQGEEVRPASSLFLFIGAAPQTDWLPESMMRDPNGFVLSGRDLRVEGQLPGSWKEDREPYLLETSMPGVFVAGDVRHGSVKRAAYSGGRRFDGGAADAPIFGAVLRDQEQMEGTTAEARVKTVTQQELSQLIRRVPVLSKLKEEDLGCLGNVELLEAPAGTVLFEQGKSGPSFCMILEGEIRTTRMEPNGIETPIAVFHDGDTFGEAPLLLGAKISGAQCMAATPVRMLRVDAERFLEADGDLPDGAAGHYGERGAEDPCLPGDDAASREADFAGHPGRGTDARAQQSRLGGEAVGGAAAGESGAAAGDQHALLRFSADPGTANLPARHAGGSAGARQAEDGGQQPGRSGRRRGAGRVAGEHRREQRVEAGADAGGRGLAAARH